MDWIEIIVLALVQGFTEFLPVSSSAHLLLVPILTHWKDQGLVFDVALHIGSLFAVVLYFRRDIIVLWFAWWDSLTRGKHGPHSQLAWGILLGTIPAGLAGLLFKDYVATELRSGVFMAYSLILFGLLLGWADWRYSKRLQQIPPPKLQNEYQMNWKQIAGIACAQALALFPGTSRSGITMTAGLMLGLTREASARFSFLLSIPIIILAAGWQGVELAGQSKSIDWQALIAGAVISAISAYVCIHFFLAVIKRMGMQPFVIYRVLLGAYLLYLLT